MAKTKTVYICSACGRVEPRWSGKCPECGEWNTFAEKLAEKSADASSAFFKGAGQLAPLHAIKTQEAKRYDSGFREINQTLGGGIVRGGAVLIGGEPGIGKSTLLLQLCHNFSKQGKALYVSGEESLGQIKMRADRLDIDSPVEVYAGTDLDAVLKTIENVRPALLVIDSAQTLYSPEAGLIPGTVNQVKRCCHEIIGVCKEHEIACFIVAHVTKDGSIAGPKAIEHLVDTVLYFEQGDNGVRLLRAVKNRFGAVDELGLFVMGEKGLFETDSKETLLFFNRSAVPGSAVACSYEGSRVFFHEIQALTVPSKGAASRVYSERIDSGRALRIAAVLEKYAGIRLSDQDVYINVSGGIKLNETGIDLPLALALYSARAGLALPAGLASAGEITLSGEVRPAMHMDKRIKTAEETGFKYFSGCVEQLLSPLSLAGGSTVQALLKAVLSIESV